MASIDIAKMTPDALMGLDVHFENPLRMKAKHSNFEIDTSKTEKNYYIGCTSWRDAADRIGDFVQMTDERQPPKRMKKDRKTWVSIWVPCPAAITDMGREEEFFQKSYDMLNSIFPAGLFGASVHLDEKHLYKDHYDSKIKDWVKKESLNHGHYWAPAYTPEKGINCTSLCTREFFQKIQDAMQDMVSHEFGVSYQTGDFKLSKDKAKYKKTVEELKFRSAKAEVEALKQVAAAMEQENLEKDRLLREKDEQIVLKEAEIARIEAEKAKTEEDTASTQKALSEARKELQEVKEDKNLIEKISDGIKRFTTVVWDSFTEAFHSFKELGPAEGKVKVLKRAQERAEKDKDIVNGVIRETAFKKPQKKHLKTIEEAEKDMKELTTDLNNRLKGIPDADFDEKMEENEDYDI